jgi:ribosomal protein S18 acetylase RimI-like enzyme
MFLTFQSISDCGIDLAAQVGAQGFADYFVPVQITPAAILSMVRQDSLDLSLSRVIFQADQPVGLALIARRGCTNWTSRLAGMCVIPAARGSGVGAWSVARLLAEARSRGDRSLTLEVIQQNTPALRLYEKCGFHIDRALVAYSGESSALQPDLELESVDIRVVARELVAHGPPDLPWQLSGETLAQVGPPSVAYHGACPGDGSLRPAARPGCRAAPRRDGPLSWKNLARSRALAAGVGRVIRESGLAKGSACAVADDHPDRGIIWLTPLI